MNFPDTRKISDGVAVATARKSDEVYGNSDKYYDQLFIIRCNIMHDNIKLTIDDIFDIRYAESADVDNIAALMQEVYSGLKNKDIFICDDRDFVARHVKDEGFILVAENRTLCVLSAVFIVRYPRRSEDNLGNYVNLTTPELLRVAHMESAVVKESARGHHLEQRLMELSISYIPDKYDIFIGTASPENIASIKAFQNNGFELAAENVSYNGLIRNVYKKVR